MAEQAKVTQEGLYTEFAPNNQVDVTQEGLYAEFGPKNLVEVTQEGMYVEYAHPSEVAYVTQAGIYIEYIPIPSSSLTEFGVDVELDGEGIQVTESGAYAEIAAAGNYLTEFGTYAEFAASGDYLTEFGVFVEFEYYALGGMIIIGSYKTWRDHYPKNVTDIPLLRAYNFIVSSNGMYMLDIEWDDVDDEDGYEIERSWNGTTDWELIHTTDPDVTKYVSIMLTPNTTYYYRIRSFNEGGYSAYSSVVSATTRKIGPSLIGMTETANNTYSPIYIKKPPEVNFGDFMIMQIGVEDIDTLIMPDGWTLETTITGVYSNLILSKTATAFEPDIYTIYRSGLETPIVTVAIFAWDGSSDEIIFFD